MGNDQNESSGTTPEYDYNSINYDDEAVQVLMSTLPPPKQYSPSGPNATGPTKNVVEVKPLTSNTPIHGKDIHLLKLTQDILDSKNYDPRVRPVLDVNRPLKIHITMSLYQIIHVNEPMQNIKMNVWMIQKWTDELINWNPQEYGMINTTIVPHSSVWVPDTYVYNSVVMNAAEMERYMNIRADSRYWEGKRGANMSFLYPAIYTVNCKFNILYFPYDLQNCTITMGSWTSDSASLDYIADENVNMQSYIPNEEWSVEEFKIYRHEYKYACCPKPWVILEASLVLRRKPLYYVINLLIPTSIISVVAILGFFTPASTGDDRTEKFNLGITTLLAMSILLLMVSDQMPTTSEFVPLIAWYYLAIIIIIAFGTILACIILHIHNRHKLGRLPPPRARYFFLYKLTYFLRVPIPTALSQLWDELKHEPSKIYAKKVKFNDILNELNEINDSNGLLNGSLKNLAVSQSVLSSKQKRQCCMEWALIATILDRICLVVFIFMVLLVTFGMTFIRYYMAHQT